MNCQPGNVAMIIKGRPANIGRIVFVFRSYGDVDYTYMGYGVLPCWNVESLGGDLDTVTGPSNRGFIPDLALRALPGLSNREALEMRKTKAQADFDAALADLGGILQSIPNNEGLPDERQHEDEVLSDSVMESPFHAAVDQINKPVDLFGPKSIPGGRTPREIYQ